MATVCSDSVNRIKLLSLFIIFSLLISCNSRNKETIPAQNVVVDALGNKFEFKQPPERVITLAPNLTEMIYEVGAGQKLVGNTLFCNYPEKAKSVEKIGDMLTVDYEKIVSLQPDLIFITKEGNKKNIYQKLISLKFKVFVSDPKSFEDIKRTFLKIGKIFGKEKSAREKIKSWDSTVDSVKNEAKKLPTKSVMFLVSVKPIMLAGKNTFINEILQICGFQNIADSSQLRYPVFSREEIVKKNPDYIIMFESKNLRAEAVKNAYPEWKELKAVKNNNIIFVDADLFARPGPRFFKAVKFLFGKRTAKYK